MTAALAPAKAPRFKSVLGWRVLNLYVDPHPGKDNSDRVSCACGRCGGSGNVGIYWVENGVCFDCRGSGRGSQSVGTARKHAKADAFHAEYGEEITAYWAAFEAAQEAGRLAKEVEEAHGLALAINARKDAQVQGFAAEVGTNVKGLGLTGQIAVAKGYESHFGYSTQYGMFLIITLDNGQVVKTSGTGRSLFGLERGDRVAIVGGSVKAHEAYDGQDQTVLIRARLERIETETDLDA